MCIATCLLGASVLVGLVSLSPTSQRPAVTLALQSVEMVSLPNGSKPVAVVVVTNTGHKAVYLNFDTLDWQEGDRWRSQWFPVLGMLGSCSLPPKTDCTVRIAGPSRPGRSPARWRVHATVFEPTSTPGKARFAALRLWMRLSGKADFKKFWFPNSQSPAYEICSPEVPGSIQPSTPLDNPLDLTEAEAVGFGPLDVSLFTDAAESRPEPPLVQFAPPNDGPATPSDNSDGSEGDRHR